MNASSLITINNVSNFTITGGGGINGSGDPWWKIRRVTPSEFAPRLVSIENSDTVFVSNVVLQNSPMFHLPMSHVNNVLVENIQVGENLNCKWQGQNKANRLLPLLSTL